MSGQGYLAINGRWIVPKRSGNPCIKLFGTGPEGKRCKHCARLYLQDGCAGTYYKCAKRTCTRGPGTDHRCNWPACGAFKEISQTRQQAEATKRGRCDMD